MHWYHWNDGGWGVGMMGLMVLFWVLAILGVLLVVRMLGRDRMGFIGPGQGPPAESALDVLKKRYARGEIDREEYDQKKHDLES